MDPYSWRCPFCGHHATIKDENVSGDSSTFADGNKYGSQQVVWKSISCPNPACREYVFTLRISDVEQILVPMPGGGGKTHSTRYKQRHAWQLVPAADMKILPAYVPGPIAADYKESCLIAQLSPKASATLSRRCLQGMIRDFWGISKRRLVDEIDAIKDKVDELAWKAIDGLRKMGNIGAHMEADINVIVDVDPDEAKLLISLIETLIDDWYVQRHERELRMKRMVATTEAKFKKTTETGV